MLAFGGLENVHVAKMKACSDVSKKPRKMLIRLPIIYKILTRYESIRTVSFFPCLISTLFNTQRVANALATAITVVLLYQGNKG